MATTTSSAVPARRRGVVVSGAALIAIWVAALLAAVLPATAPATPRVALAAYTTSSGHDVGGCLLGRLPNANGSAGPCAGPGFDWNAVSKRAQKCLKGATIGGLGGLGGGGFRGAIRGGLKIAGRAAADVGLEGLAGGCIGGQFVN